ncbi:MAG TPA: 4'-phosphopantetheinyl transferase superfamily protein [Chitinophagaceae bacterium]|nr:4'-phosphopantetheinyl transferase superfamily protein [Chitinophagaceae bacterium]
MPLFYQQTIDRHTKIGIWKIEESENFFLQTVPLQNEITHPHKRVQHLAGRHLLRYLFPDFPYELIRIADTLKPFLANEAYHFSISHCGDFAAAIVSRDKRVGIDIELVAERVGKVKDKFINTIEAGIIQQFRVDMPDLLKFTLMWSCKEAMFKWHGNGQVDFRRHMQLQAIYRDEIRNCIFTDFLFSKEKARLLKLQTVFLEKFALSWLATAV